MGKPSAVDDEEDERSRLLFSGHHHNQQCKRKAASGCQQRHVVCFISLLMMTCSHLTRTNISVAMVAMVNYTAIGHVFDENHHSHSTNVSEDGGSWDLGEDDGDDDGDDEESCKVLDGPSYVRPPDGEFVWSPEVQGIIHGSFFWGNLAALLPGGLLAQRYGGKNIVLIGIILMGASSLLFPLSTAYGVAVICLGRALGGVGHALGQTAIQTILARWMPKDERATISGIIYSGSPIGTMTSLSLTGILTDSGFLGGWPSSFYIFGLVGMSVAFVWFLFIFESPNDNPWISVQEMKYIESSIGMTKTKLSTPWKEILLSPPVWALLCAQGAFHWTLFTLNALIPTYMRVILHFDIKANGLLSALPYLIRVAVSLSASFVSDWLFRNGLSLTTCRKIMVSASLLLPAVVICCVPYIGGCDPVVSVALITLGMSLTGCIFCCAFANSADLSPNFSGAIASIVHIPGNIGGIAAPYVAGLLLDDLDALSHWAVVFFLCGAVSLIANVIYLAFGSAEEQPWNYMTDFEDGDRDRLLLEGEEEKSISSSIQTQTERVFR